MPKLPLKAYSKTTRKVLLRMRMLGKRIFKTPMELRAGCSDYAQWCEENKKRLTKTGLALFLEIHPVVLNNYVNGKRGPEFKEVMEWAYTRIEEDWVQRLDQASAGGSMFYLKNMFHDKYKDKLESELLLRKAPLTAFLESIDGEQKTTLNESEDERVADEPPLLHRGHLGTDSATS